MKLLKETYHPQYFLAALGSGGLAVSFFMYFMFLIPHPKTGMPTFNDIYPYLTGNHLLVSILIGLNYLIILYFAYRHFKLLYWNAKQFLTYKETNSYKTLKASNGVANLMAIPLTFAMSMNMLFILGAILVPNLWNVIEYMMPLAIIGFAIVGYYALKIYIPYFMTFLQGNYDLSKNNHFGQMLAIFAFAMIGVGLAAPAGMSRVLPTSSIAMILSIFFTMIAVSIGAILFILSVFSMMKYGISKEAAPSLWIAIPILTLLGITFVRLFSGINHNFFHIQPSPVVLFIVLGSLLSLQIMFGLVGYLLLKKLNYFNKFTAKNSPQKSPNSYGLVCPGVAIVVLGMFFIGWGLVKTNLVPAFSIYYYIILLPFILIQLKTLRVLLRLNKKLLQ